MGRMYHGLWHIFCLRNSGNVNELAKPLGFCRKIPQGEVIPFQLLGRKNNLARLSANPFQHHRLSVALIRVNHFQDFPMTKTNSDNARSLTAEGIKLALLSTWRFDYELLNLAQSVADQIVQPNTKAKIVSAIVVSGFGNNIVEEAVVGPFEVDVPRGFSYRSGRLRREYPLNTRD